MGRHRGAAGADEDARGGLRGGPDQLEQDDGSHRGRIRPHQDQDHPQSI